MSTDALIVAPTNDDALIDKWLKGKRRQSAHTQRAYRRDIEMFRQATGFKPLRAVNGGDAVSVADLEWYSVSLAEKGLSPSSQRRMIASVRSLLTYGLKVGYLAFNVGAAVDMDTPADTLPKRILSKSDVDMMLLSEPDRGKRAILRLAYVLAARVSELCALRWGDVETTDTGYVFRIVGKGDKARSLFVDAEDIRADLDTLRARSTKTLVGVGPTQVWRYAREAAARAGLDRDANGDERHISPHWLRHAAISRAVQRGAPLSLVQEYAGHSSLAMTTRYAHAMPKEGLSKYLL